MRKLFETLPEQVEQGEAARSGGRVRLRQPDRDQLELRVCDLDALIASDHPARIIWAYAERLDLSALEDAIGSREGHAGHPALAPRLALALWLYATSEGVGSARELERLCESEAAYRWLCGGVSVNYHTLSSFRSEQSALIDRLLIEHVAALAGAGIIDLDEMAQDGIRVRANAGAASFRRRATLEEKARALVEALGRDEDDDPGASGRRRKARIERARRERAAKVEQALAALAEVEAQRARRGRTNKTRTRKQKEPRASTSDPDARVMKMADGGFRPAYNVQFASLPQTGIIIAVEAGTVGSDRGLASPLRAAIAKSYGRQPARYLVDGGYQAKACIEAAASDKVAFYCPPGETKAGSDPYAPHKRDTPALAEWRKRMVTDEAKAIYKRRAIAELVHARLRNLGLDHLLLRGREKVKTCMLWFALASNILTGARLASAKPA